MNVSLGEAMPIENGLAHLTAMSDIVAGLRFEDLDKTLIERVKVHLLDTLGASLAGTRSAEYHKMAQIVSPGDEARLWGTNRRSTIRDAAMANGVAAHVFELDDTGGCDHSGAVVVPAILASLGSGKNIRGRDLICATLAGYEVGRRVLEASGGYGAHNGAGWHSTGTCGTMAAAAAVTRLHRRTALEMRNAIALSTSFSSGLWAFIHDGSQAKKLHAGRAAEGGILAAELAAKGISGPSRVFDDVWGGFFRSFVNQPGDVTAFSAGLGTDWKINRVSLKPYAACRSAHSAVDAVSDILVETGLTAVQIAAIDLRLSPFLMDMCGTADLSTLAGAQMSLAYVLAVSCIHGKAGLDEYAMHNRKNPLIAEVMAKVSFRPDPAIPQMDEPIVTVTFQDGTCLTRMVPRATGSPERPMSPNAIEAKFDRLAAMAVPEQQVQAIKACIAGLEAVDDCEILVDLLDYNGPERPIFS